MPDIFFLDIGLLEKRFEDKYFPKLNLALGISKVILKNAIFSTNKNKMRVDWLKGSPDPLLQGSVSYKRCTDEEKLEIMDFLSRLYKLSINDGLLKITCQVGLNSIDQPKLISTNSIDLYTKIAERISDKIGTPLADIMALKNPQSYDEKIKIIKENFEQRGVVTWLPDDAFNPTISGFGYSFIGIKILEDILKP